jgi:predicted nucleotidyltransferase
MHEPLGAILGTRAKVAVLRILWRATSPLPYREVVRRSGMAYGSIDLALGELGATGLIEEWPGGRERRVQFRSAHRLAAAVASLLHVEADFYPALRIELRAISQPALGDGLLSVAIFGAAARREERLGSDLELVLISGDRDASARNCRQVAAGAVPLESRFGVRVKLVGYDLATAKSMWRTRTAAAMSSVREAELLAGQPLEPLLTG